MKKKVLISYIGMLMGGSTTSLLSLLNELDNSLFEVDLALYDRDYPFEKYIPSYVNVLGRIKKYENKSKFGRFVKMLRYIMSGYWIKHFYYIIKYRCLYDGSYAKEEYKTYRNSEKNTNEYDVAIGFMEGWSDRYISTINAKKTIMWLHLDFKNVQHVNVNLMGTYLEKADTIVCVSEECRKNFISLFPKYENRTIYLPNILSQTYVKQRALEPVSDSDFKEIGQYKGIRIITACRLAIYHKGIDRMIYAASQLKQKGIEFRWYLLGEGSEKATIEKLIKEYDVEDYFILLGGKINPYPYIALADIFCMPSRYEGKPMAITEAMMLGVVPVVTAYASAKEQIENEITGIIVENNDIEIAKALKELCNNSSLITQIKKELYQRDFSNTNEISAIEKMIFE